MTAFRLPAFSGRSSGGVLAMRITAAIALAAVPAGAQGRGRCGADASFLVREYRDFFSSTDSAAAAHRALFQLPRVPAKDIVAVTDSATCARAADAYYHTTLGPASRQYVAVVRAGKLYLVFGSERAGEWSIVEILDENFDEIEGITR
jgi:hypothetical protein